MTSRFDAIQPDLLKHEGGYVDHPDDPGGATNQGITLATFQRHFPGRLKSDLRRMTPDIRDTIYIKDYWNKVHAGEMWPGLDRVAYDAAVHSGPRQSLKWVQRAVMTGADGLWGAKTSSAIWSDRLDRVEAVQRACAYRMSMLRGLRHWDTFKNGWSRRVAEVEAKAAREAGAGHARTWFEFSKAKGAATAQATGAAGAGTGTGGVLVTDMPLEAIGPAAAILAFCCIVLLLKARHNRNRAAAYDALN